MVWSFSCPSIGLAKNVLIDFCVISIEMSLGQLEEAKRKLFPLIAEYLDGFYREHVEDALLDYLFLLAAGGKKAKVIASELETFFGDHAGKLSRWLTEEFADLLRETVEEEKERTRKVKETRVSSMRAGNEEKKALSTKRHREKVISTQREGRALYTKKAKAASELSSGVVIGSGDKEKRKCKYFPNCNSGNECLYFHPSEICIYFPSCSYGPKCMYIHSSKMIPCRYGSECKRPSCSFEHSTESVQVCRFDLECTKVNCKFRHPKKEAKVRALVVPDASG